MKLTTYVTATFGAALLLFSTPAYVHHSGAMFDGSKQVQITGTVVRFNWTNPHASFVVSVVNASGGTDIWAVEMNSPNGHVREGWKRTSLKPGDKITATVRPMANGTPGGQYVSVVLADGTVLGAKPTPSAQ